MKIDRVYIACYRGGVHLTRCCVASIRRWYPLIPISLIKDELDGPYGTDDMQEYWGVDVLATRHSRFGRGMSKFEALTQPRHERCLVLDNDIVFLGEVIDRLERFDEDFIVACHAGPPEEIERHFFVLDLLGRLDPSFRYGGGAFNTGQFVATTGMFDQADLAPFLTDREPRTVRRPDVFKAAEQGLLNYLLLKRCQAGGISLRHDEFMWWSEWLEEGRVTPGELDGGSAVPVLLHWAGPKPPAIDAMRHAAILRYFERLYYSRIPGGGPPPPATPRQSAEQARRAENRRRAAVRLFRGGARVPDRSVEGGSSPPTKS